METAGCRRLSLSTSLRSVRITRRTRRSALGDRLDGNGSEQLAGRGIGEKERAGDVPSQSRFAPDWRAAPSVPPLDRGRDAGASDGYE